MTRNPFYFKTPLLVTVLHTSVDCETVGHDFDVRLKQERGMEVGKIR